MLTLVGDLTPDEGFAAAERYFGPLPPTATPSPTTAHTLLPLDDAGPARSAHEAVPNDRLHLAFRLPADHTDEFNAVALALDAVGGLSSSRLVQRLVRDEQTATSLAAHTMGFVDGVSLGFITADIADGVDPDKVEAAICEELDGFLDDGPTDEELESALAETERSWLSALANPEERADHICHYAALHDDPAYVNTFLASSPTSPPSRCARRARYLRPDARAVVAYLVDGEQEAVVSAQCRPRPSPRPDVTPAGRVRVPAGDPAYPAQRSDRGGLRPAWAVRARGAPRRCRCRCVSSRREHRGRRGAHGAHPGRGNRAVDLGAVRPAAGAAGGGVRGRA